MILRSLWAIILSRDHSAEVRIIQGSSWQRQRQDHLTKIISDLTAIIAGGAIMVLLPRALIHDATVCHDVGRQCGLRLGRWIRRCA
jgi:hypothetical protein